MRLQSVQRRESFEKAIRIRKPCPISCLLNIFLLYILLKPIFLTVLAVALFSKNKTLPLVRTMMNSFFFKIKNRFYYIVFFRFSHYCRFFLCMYYTLNLQKPNEYV